MKLYLFYWPCHYINNKLEIWIWARKMADYDDDFDQDDNALSPDSNTFSPDDD